jgi:hypothetical protein
MSAPELRNEDEAAQYYLSALRTGTRAEKVVARDGLAAIFSRRGLFEEAAELFELNVKAGVRTPELFQQLSGVYRALGDDESARAALAEARRLEQEAAVAHTPTPPPTLPMQRVAGAPETDGQATSRVAGVAVPAEAEADELAVGRVNGVEAADDRSATVAVRHGPAPVAPSDATARLALERSEGMSAPWAAPQTQPTVARADAATRGGLLSSLPTPVMVLGVVLFMIVLPVVLLAVLVVNPIALYLEGRAAGPTVVVGASTPAQVKIAPGSSSAWYIQAGRSVSGLWATPGLELSLDQEIEGAGRRFAVTGARPQSWGETITIVERRGQGRANQTMVMPATFEAQSSLPPAGTALDGHITGQVTAPRLSETSQFNTTTESIDVPVRLVVVSTPSLWLDRFQNAVGMYFDEERWLLVTIGALLAWCVLAGVAAIVFRVGQR